jgi:hypothetical protein
LHGGQSTSRKIPTPVTDVTGSDEISGAYFALGRICSGVDITTAHTRGRHARGARSI